MNSHNINLSLFITRASPFRSRKHWMIIWIIIYKGQIIFLENKTLRNLFNNVIIFCSFNVQIFNKWIAILCNHATKFLILIVIYIIHVLTEALLSLSLSPPLPPLSLVRATSKGKALSKSSGTVYKDLFRFWDGYFLFPGVRQRARQIFPKNLFCRSRYTYAHGPIRLVGIVELQDLLTWPCLLCARVIHFFLLGCTSRHVVDRVAPGSVVFYERISMQIVDRVKITSIHLSMVQWSIW